jgi:hypothetical protein
LRIASREFKIDGVSLAVFVAVARRCVRFARRTKYFRTQELGIRLRQSESRRKYPSLMPPAWMSRVEAIVAKFGDVHDGALAAGNFISKRE